MTYLIDPSDLTTLKLVKDLSYNKYKHLTSEAPMQDLELLIETCYF